MPIHALPISRRRFLAGSAALLAGAQIGGRSLADDGTSNKWALLADVHLIHPSTLPLLPPAEQSNGKTKAPLIRQRLSRVVEEISLLKRRPSGVILNGDCAHLGTPSDYKFLLDQVGKLFQAELPVHFTLGNHDHRPNFMKSRPTSGHSSLIHDRYVSTLQTPKANLLLLDSLKMREPESPNRRELWSHIQTSGLLGEEQLQWFARALDQDAEKPTLVVAHHNVSPSKAFLARFHDKTTYLVPPLSGGSLAGGLDDTDPFLELILNRKQVKVVFCGHKHRFEVRRWNGIYFVFLPAVGYPFDPKDAVGWLECDLQDHGMRIKAHTLDHRHPHSGKTVDLRWT